MKHWVTRREKRRAKRREASWLNLPGDRLLPTTRKRLHNFKRRLRAQHPDLPTFDGWPVHYMRSLDRTELYARTPEIEMTMVTKERWISGTITARTVEGP